ncbi:hypothetical protein GCM10023169_38900 [Georgenia halophila]|uniref:Uncharacterized protein n=1 Tax=Georgenia halophila TaxID=620889 RepID=A0ABP8LQS0_9MICO
MSLSTVSLTPGSSGSASGTRISTAVAPSRATWEISADIAASDSMSAAPLTWYTTAWCHQGTGLRPARWISVVVT